MLKIPVGTCSMLKIPVDTCSMLKIPVDTCSMLTVLRVLLSCCVLKSQSSDRN